MFEKFNEHGPFWLLAIFAVLSGQVGRLGYKGQPITRRTIWVEMSMLPAFGSIGGSIAAEHDAPVYIILVCGVAAGWLGFACFAILASFVVTVFQTAVEKIASGKANPPDS